MMKFNYLNTWVIIFIFISSACDNLKEDFNIKTYKNPVKIGVVGDVTLGREISENIFFAIKMAANEINENGGLTIEDTEQEIELIFKNSGGDPELGEKVVNELIEEGVNIIIGPTISAVAVDMAKLCIEKNILMMTYSSTIPELSGLDDNDLIWRTCPSDAFSGNIMATYSIDSLHFSRGAILYRDDKFGVAMTNVIRTKFNSLGGEIIASISYPTDEIELNLYNYSNEINDILELEPQIIFTIAFEQEIGKITQDFWASSLYQNDQVKPQIFLSEGGFLSELITNGQPQILETIYGISSSISQNPNYIAFKNNYIQHFNFEPVGFAEHAYDALYSIAYAMIKAQSILPNDIKQNLRLVTGGGILNNNTEIINVNEYEKAKNLLSLGIDINYEGASGSISFDENGDPKSKYVIWGIRDGEYIEFSIL